MAFEALIASLTWIFIVIIPFAMLVVFLDDVVPRRPAPLVEIPYPEAYVPHLRGRSSSPDDISPTRPRRISSARLHERRGYEVGKHLNRLTAQRDFKTTFDNGSDFDFQPEEKGRTDESKSEVEDSVLNRSEPILVTRSKCEEDGVGKTRQKCETNETVGMPPSRSLLCKQEEDASNNDSTRGQHGTLTRSSASESTSIKATATRKSRQSSINAHIDQLTRQQRIQDANWNHVDVPFDQQNSGFTAEDANKELWYDPQDFSEQDKREKEIFDEDQEVDASTHSATQTPSSQIASGDVTRSPKRPTTSTEAEATEHKDARNSRVTSPKRGSSRHRLPYAHRNDAEPAHRHPPSRHPSPHPSSHLQSPSHHAPPSFAALWSSDPIFAPADTVSPSVRRQVEDQAGFRATRTEDFNADREHW